ncbi:MAG: hypothetical protein ACAH11_04755 [Sphingomonas sp.]
MRHLARLAILSLIGIGAAAPSNAQEEVFYRIAPEHPLKAWAPNEWHVWAMPAFDQCLALAEEPQDTPFKFWGFRQSPGSRVEMIMGSMASPRPRTLQMSFNDGGRFDYAARVERFSDWDAYVISLQPNALSVFHSSMTFEAFVGGQRIFLSVSNSMKNLEKRMTACLEWQQSH